jgi:hypothetical protein
MAGGIRGRLTGLRATNPLHTPIVGAVVAPTPPPLSSDIGVLLGGIGPVADHWTCIPEVTSPVAHQHPFFATPIPADRGFAAYLRDLADRGAL